MNLRKIIFFFAVSFIFINPCKAFTPSVEYPGEFYFNVVEKEQLYSEKFGFLIVDDNVVFSLDPHKELGDSYDINNNYFNGYNKDDFDYMKMVYNYVNNHIQERNIYYYMAAHELIWEQLYWGNEVFFTMGLNGIGEVIDLEDIKYEINSNVYGELIKPSFNGTIVKDNFNTVVELIDKNRVLENYDIINNSNNNVWKIDNKLYIEILSSELGEIKLVKKMGQGDPIYYYSDNKKHLAFLNAYVENISTIKVQANNEYSEDININFLDKKNNLLINEPIKFQIVNTNNDEVVLNSETYNGMYYINLTTGNYELKIDNIPNNYLYVDPIQFSVDEKNQNISHSILIYLDVPIGQLNVNVLKEDGLYQLYAKKDESDTLICIFDKTKSFNLDLGSYYVVDISTNKKYDVVLEYKDTLTPIIIYDLNIYPDKEESNEETSNDKDKDSEEEKTDDNSQDDSSDKKEDNSDMEDDSISNNNADNDVPIEGNPSEKEDISIEDSQTSENNHEQNADDKLNNSDLDDKEETIYDKEDNNSSNDNLDKDESDKSNEKENTNQIEESISNNGKDNFNSLDTLPNTYNYIRTIKRYLFVILLLGVMIKFKKNEKE